MSGAFSGDGENGDVDAFMTYASPSERRTELAAGTSHFPVLIYYGPTIDPATFSAELDRTDVTRLFTPEPGGFELVNVPLVPGRSTLVLSVQGESRGRTSTDTDRLVFLVP